MSDASDPSTANFAPLSESKHRAEGARQHFVAWLFSEPNDPASAKDVIAWWELRRLPFNFVVGTSGVLCLVVFLAAIETSGHLRPGEDAVEPLALMMAPIIVNVLYTLGWVVETAYRSSEPVVSPRFGPRLFELGLGLGLFFSALPATFWCGYRLLQCVGIAT
jgi:hypothetical protein